VEDSVNDDVADWVWELLGFVVGFYLLVYKAGGLGGNLPKQDFICIGKLMIMYFDLLLEIEAM
jgi:hypothetical protein